MEIRSLTVSCPRLLFSAPAISPLNSPQNPLFFFSETLKLPLPFEGQFEDTAHMAPLVFEELSTLYYKMRQGYSTADATVSFQKLATKLAHEDFSAVTPQDLTLDVRALKEIERLTRVKKKMEEAATPC